MIFLSKYGNPIFIEEEILTQTYIEIPPKRGFKMPNLGFQILIALILGIVAGIFLHDYEAKQWIIDNLFYPAGQILIIMIKMIVVPIVISTLTVGIAGGESTKELGKMGFKTILYFEIITTIAIVVGIVAANIFQPGSGLDINTLVQADISSFNNTIEEMSDSSQSPFVTTLLSIFPSNIFAAMSNNNSMLAVIFFSVLFGLGLATLPNEQKTPVIVVLKGISGAMFKVTNMIMRYAPIGVFALIATTVANFGYESLIPLLKLAILVYAAIIFFAVVVLGIVAFICGLNIFTLLRILKDELILAYTTASSETVLPRIMEKMERYGAPARVTGFVIPIGYSFNLDGSTLYQSIAAIFLAQITGVDLSITDQIILVITLMLTSKGIAGVPGVSIVVLLATIGTVGIPLESVAYIIGIDRILDMARTALNVVGNALAALVIAKWEGAFDSEKAANYFKDSQDLE